jgi:hypothetical protein
MNGKSPFPVPAMLKTLALVALLSGAALVPASVRANDLPLAAGSPLAGFSFDDRPLLLPVQRNFQMALLTASSELGRSCGKMEAYGWRMGATEQQRVNQIFNNTVDRLRGLGYSVESQAPSSVSNDITLFTADRADKHFMFMWSAGEIGLAMVLCESTAPVGSRLNPKSPAVQVFPQTNDVLAAELQTPVQGQSRRAMSENFTPVGDWVGSYTCKQGYTGGTLRIAKLNGENFTGYFHFYPTTKNPYVPDGRYEVYGQYDRASQRILINPGKWLERPKNYYDTIMVGSFDPMTHTFSAYFQGINGCTSFEAKGGDEDIEALNKKSAHKTIKKTHKTKKKITRHALKPAAISSSDRNTPTLLPLTASPATATSPLSIVPDQPPANVPVMVTPAAPAATPVAPPAAAPAAPVPATPAAATAPATPAAPVATTPVTPVTAVPPPVTPAAPAK